MVTLAIRELIVTGRVGLGEQLSENVLAEQLGVSRTPVREAFLHLAAERLVEVRPQRGTFVFDCDARLVRDICQLRGILEAGALSLACERHRQRLIAELAAAVETAEAAFDGDPAGYQPHDTRFHDLLVRASDNAQLIEAYGRIAGRVWALRSRFNNREPLVRNSMAEHRMIVEHLRTGDDDAAQAILARHVYNAYRAFQARFTPAGERGTA
jgi:DNA-binding GntR family transcriptional regulator